MRMVIKKILSSIIDLLITIEKGGVSIPNYKFITDILNIEAKNRLIGILLFNANGYTNFKRSRNRIMYCLNKLDTFKIK